MASSKDELFHQIVFGVTRAIADMIEHMSKEPATKEVPADICLRMLAQTIRDTNSKFMQALADRSTRH